jgi:hypothetical protein
MVKQRGRNNYHVFLACLPATEEKGCFFNPSKPAVKAVLLEVVGHIKIQKATKGG